MATEMNEMEHNLRNPLMAGLAVGVVLGVTAVLISDKKNQKKMHSAVESIKKWAVEKSEELGEKREEMANDGHQTLHHAN